jgi:RNA polymerase sigma-70 factor (ECF subfamily)
MIVMTASRASRVRPQLRVVPRDVPPPPAPPTDEQVIEAVQQGDDRVSMQLYDRLLPVVDHTLYRVFGRREADHDDLVQASFEQIVVTLSRQSYARACSLRTWAATVASHVGLNALRSRRRERRVVDRGIELEDHLTSSFVDVESEVTARRQLEQVRTELSSMSPKRALAVFLHDVLGHELAEIALITGVSVAAAQSRLVRGRRELFRRLGKTHGVARREA